MSQFDFSPLFRAGVGFDRLARLAETALQQAGEQSAAYPPYNIEKTGENAYAITLAVAGFSETDLDIEVTGEMLTVRGSRRTATAPTAIAPTGAANANANGDAGTPTPARQVLHRGIAERDFVRRFQLADHMKVTGAALENGLLTVTLVREIPEAAKPRHIAISRSTGVGTGVGTPALPHAA